MAATCVHATSAAGDSVISTTQTGRHLPHTCGEVPALKRPSRGEKQLASKANTKTRHLMQGGTHIPAKELGPTLTLG
jgi:hypothetical protein